MFMCFCLTSDFGEERKGPNTSTVEDEILYEVKFVQKYNLIFIRVIGIFEKQQQQQQNFKVT